MDLRVLVLSLACLLLMTTTAVYGFKLITRHNNYLLGVEWLVVTFSATNFLLFITVGSETGYGISMFLDAFSRGFGIPFVAVAGLMVITHNFKPTILLDVLVFAITIPATLMLRSDFMVTPLPYFYIVVWALFSIYLAYFAKQLLSVGEKGHAFSVIVALVSSGTIACIYDFYKIPGEETNIVFNFFVLALTTWSFLFGSLYHAYSALARAKGLSALSKDAMQETAVAAALSSR